MGKSHSHSHDHDDHHHDHGHSHHHHGHGSSKLRKNLILTIFVTALLFFAELIGGYVFHSLALISDAGHMFVDLSALALSFFALWISNKKATSSQTFGYHRAEVIAALINCLTLWGMMILIFIEAIHRFRNPVEVQTTGMIFIAVLGLIANILGMIFLHGHKHDNVNIKSSYLHLLSDMFGSVATIISGIIMSYTKTYQVDAIASFVIGALTIFSSWGLLKETIYILMESAPDSINTNEVKTFVEKHPSIASIHDLHIWQLTQTKVSLSLHGVLKKNANHNKTLHELSDLLREKYKIAHSTIQLEETDNPLECDSCE